MVRMGPRMGPLQGPTIGPNPTLGVPVDPPVGFGWSPPWSVLEMSSGVFTTTLDPVTLRRSTSVTLYVDIATGNDGNPGTNPLLPIKSISVAINLWTNATIYVKAGTYPEANSWSGGVPFGAEQNIIAVADFTTLSPGSVISQASAGVRNGWLNTALSIYVGGITFEGGGNGVAAFWAQHASTIAMVNCAFTGGNFGGFAMSSNAAAADHTVYLINCTMSANPGDGVDYTALGAGSTIRALEYGCTYTSNSGAGTDQGSSAHFTAGNTAVSIVRVNGRFTANKSAGFADVGGATVWALGCRFVGEAVGALVDDATTAWLHGCTFSGGTTDLRPVAAASVINIHDTNYVTTSGAGTVGRYVP